jgi:guanylate kinase
MDVYSQIPQNLKMILFIGASGAGKNSIAKRFIEENSNCRFPISACTKEKTEKDIEGVDYYFMSKSEFKRKERAGEFVETNEFRGPLKKAGEEGDWYGTLFSEIVSIHEQGNIIVKDLDINGAILFKKILKDNCLTIFITATEEERRQRIINRKRVLSEAETIERVMFGNIEQDLATIGLQRVFIDHFIENSNGKQEEVSQEVQRHFLNFLKKFKLG